METEYTQDSLLGGKISLRQPLKGYRVAIDPVFLAASIPSEGKVKVLDAGAGSGAASLCLATRSPDCRIVGIEIQKEYVKLAAENIILNGLSDRVEIIQGNLLVPPPRLAAGTFDHVMTNPPYLEHTKGKDSPQLNKTLAHKEMEADLKSWAKFCLLMVKPKGFVTIIHRADRLDQLLSYYEGKLGNIHVYPLWPGKGKPAKRVIVRGQKNSSTPLKLCQGMILHEETGEFTAQAQGILKHGNALEIG